MKKLYSDFRNFFYQRNILNKLESLTAARVLTNLRDAKTIGIIYDSTDSANDITISKFAEQLRKDGKTVEILGFVNDKKIEQKEGIEIFTKKNLNWTLIPTAENANSFAQKKFDLMFAAFITENLPLEYVVRISQAKWRVGCYSPAKTDFYEMMINRSGKTDLNYFLEQAVSFLNQIKYDAK
jgi:hypothetical protein